MGRAMTLGDANTTPSGVIIAGYRREGDVPSAHSAVWVREVLSGVLGFREVAPVLEGGFDRFRI